MSAIAYNATQHKQQAQRNTQASFIARNNYNKLYTRSSSNI